MEAVFVPDLRALMLKAWLGGLSALFGCVLLNEIFVGGIEGWRQSLESLVCFCCRMRRSFSIHLKGSFDSWTILRIGIDHLDCFVHQRASLFCVLFLETTISLAIFEEYGKAGSSDCLGLNTNKSSACFFGCRSVLALSFEMMKGNERCSIHEIQRF